MAAAEDVVREEGIEALTMRRLATEVGSSTVALYRHIEDKKELLVLLLDRMTARRPRTELPDDPRERLIVLWQRIHDGLARHPWVVEVLAAGNLMAREALGVLEDVDGAFAACGLPPEHVATAWRVVWQFTIGDLTMRHGRHNPAYDVNSAFGPYQLELISTVDPERFPAVAAQAPYAVQARSVDTYAADVARVIDGMIAGVVDGVLD